MDLQLDLRDIKTSERKTIDLDTITIGSEAPAEEPARQYYFMAKCRAYVRAESEKRGRELTCAVITFGNRMIIPQEGERKRAWKK